MLLYRVSVGAHSRELASIGTCSCVDSASEIHSSSIFQWLCLRDEEKLIKMIKIQYFNWHHTVSTRQNFFIPYTPKEPGSYRLSPFLCFSFFASFSKQWKDKWSEPLCVPPISNPQLPHPSRILAKLNALLETLLASGLDVIFFCQASVTSRLLWASYSRVTTTQ